MSDTTADPFAPSTTHRRHSPTPASRRSPALLRAHQRFVIVSHLRPDGDALGCTIAMGLSLRAMGKDVTLWNEDGMLDKLRFLPGSELVSTPPRTPQDFDVLVALDTAAYPRLGTPLQPSARPADDQHRPPRQQPGYGDLAHIDATSPATGQILYELLAGHDCRSTATSPRTSSRRFPPTRVRSIPADQRAHVRDRRGAGPPGREGRRHLARRSTRAIRCGGWNSCACCSTHETHRRTPRGELRAFAAHRRNAWRAPEDNEGLIDHLCGIDTVLVAVFFEELDGGWCVFPCAPRRLCST